LQQWIAWALLLVVSLSTIVSPEQLSTVENDKLQAAVVACTVVKNAVPYSASHVEKFNPSSVTVPEESQAMVPRPLLSEHATNEED
jgi:hypothetical protein